MISAAEETNNSAAAREFGINEKQAKTKQAVIPGGLTSTLQPLDVCLSKPFKDCVRTAWIDWMSAELTKGGNLKKPGLSTVAQWVLDSRQSIDADMVARSFKKTGISNALDGTEDNVLWTPDSNSRVNDDADSEDDRDTDEQLCLANYAALFGNDDTSNESDLEGFEK